MATIISLDQYVNQRIGMLPAQDKLILPGGLVLAERDPGGSEWRDITAPLRHYTGYLNGTSNRKNWVINPDKSFSLYPLIGSHPLMVVQEQLTSRGYMIPDHRKIKNITNDFDAKKIIEKLFLEEGGLERFMGLYLQARRKS